MLNNKEWMEDLSAADVIFVATHSQGSIVSTHLLDRLLREGHIRTSPEPTPKPTVGVESVIAGGASTVTVVPVTKSQRICCLAVCGIHLGPLRYLSSSSIVGPYIQVRELPLLALIYSLTRSQYFESAAAKELFQFQVSSSSHDFDFLLT
jgi:hypothetical protein